MKKIILISLLASLLPLRAQEEFQWAHHFGGECRVVCAETDSKGNIYLLGNDERSGSYQGESLQTASFILKLNPQGEVVWKKLVYNPGSVALSAHYMRLVGDSALVAMMPVTLYSPNKNVYFLDTLLPSTSPFFPQDTFSTISRYSNTAMVVLDTAGRLKDCHFMRQVALDSLGGFNGQSPTGYALSMCAPLAVDGEGYVYLAGHLTFGRQALQENGIALLLDGRHGGTLGSPAPCTNRSTAMQNPPFLVKLTPRLDSIVWCRYIFPEVRLGGSCTSFAMGTPQSMTGITVTPDNEIVVCGNLFVYPQTFTRNLADGAGHGYEEYFDSTWSCSLLLDRGDTSKRIDLMYGHSRVNFLIKFNGDGEALACKRMRYSQRVPFRTNSVPDVITMLYSPVVSDDGQSLFLLTTTGSGTMSDTTRYWNLHMDDGRVIAAHLDGGFLQFDIHNLDLIGYGLSGSTFEAEPRGYTPYCLPTLALRNGQILSQIAYRNGSISAHDGTRIENTERIFSLALLRFHEDGHLISALDYNSRHDDNRCGPIVFDGNGDLILTDYIAAPNATFGDHMVQGNGTFVIAKLHDPTFNAPYVPEPKEQSILWEQELTLPLAAAALPLTATATSGLTVNYSVDDPAIARLSHDTLLLLAPGTTTLRANQPGDAWWLPAPELSRPLTVTPTPNGILTTDHSPLTTEYYDLLGRKVSAPQRGVYLERTVTTQGVSTRKIVKP